MDSSHCCRPCGPVRLSQVIIWLYIFRKHSQNIHLNFSVENDGSFCARLACAERWLLGRKKSASARCQLHLAHVKKHAPFSIKNGLVSERACTLPSFSSRAIRLHWSELGSGSGPPEISKLQPRTRGALLRGQVHQLSTISFQTDVSACFPEITISTRSCGALLGCLLSFFPNFALQCCRVVWS